MTSRRTRATSTVSGVPNMTSSHTRSVSNPRNEPCTPTPLVERPFDWRKTDWEGAGAVFTTDMWTWSCAATSSKRRRISGLSEGEEAGTLSKSDRGTLIAIRVCEQRWRDPRHIYIKTKTNRYGNFADDRAPCGHNLLISAREVKVPAFATLWTGVGDNAAVGGGSLCNKFVDCLLRDIADDLLVQSSISGRKRGMLQKGIGVSVILRRRDGKIGQGKGGRVNVHD